MYPTTSNACTNNWHFSAPKTILLQNLISPEFNFGPNADFLYGKCLFTGAGGSSLALAEELTAAARSKMMHDSMPPRYQPLQPYEVRIAGGEMCRLSLPCSGRLIQDLSIHPVSITKLQTQYWKDMINGTGDDYYVYPENDTTVNVWDYKQCIEVSLGNCGTFRCDQLAEPLL